MQFRHIPVLVGLMLAVSPAFAQVVHNEAIDGDLSGVGPSPTELVFGVGLNTIQGSFGSAPAGVDGGATNGNDADIFTFTLGAGQSVESITTTRTGAGTLSFIGHSSTSSISDFDDNASLGAAITTGSLFGNGAVTTGVQGGGIPTTLSEGPQTFILQETAAGSFDYSISFNVVQAVPEPSSAALLGGLALVGFIRRRRK